MRRSGCVVLYSLALCAAACGDPAAVQATPGLVLVEVTGSGVVVSSPQGISCHPTCEATFGANQSVTLTAVPATGYLFAGWSGACTGMSTDCTFLTAEASQSAAAAFMLRPPSSIAYPASPFSCIVGVTCTIAAPTHGGGAATWSIAPALPAGLLMTAETGAIDGAPTALSAAATYRVTATNAGGSASASIDLAVVAAPTYSIHGTVAGTRGPGTHLSLGGAATASTIADASGTYAFSGLSSGVYSISVEQSGAGFSAGSQSVTLSAANPPSVNFAAVSDVCTPDGWCWDLPSLTGAGLYSVWGSSTHDVWAVGDGSTILHFDGQTWSDAKLWSIAGDQPFKAVWGTGASDVWIVGNSSVLHYDGVAWADRTAEISAHAGGVMAVQFNALWGNSADNVWIAGFQGVFHFDGTTYTYFDLNDGLGISALWGNGASDVFLAEGSGQIQRFNGTAFQVISTPATGTITALWGSGPGDVWAVGEFTGIEHFDGTAWTVRDTSTVASYFVSVAGTGANDVWLTGDHRLFHWDGTAFTTFEPAPIHGQFAVFHALWIADGADLWAVGAPGQIYRYDGHAFTPYLQSEGVTWPVQGIWGSSPSDLWAITQNYFLHYDGLAWSIFSDFTGRLYGAIAGSGANDVWTAGPAGRMSHWDGASWTLVPTPDNNDLAALWVIAPDDAWAGEATGQVLHWNGTAWTLAGHPVLASVFRLWGSAANDVWAIGLGGRTHWDGSAWSMPEGPPTGAFDESIWGSGPNDVWMTQTSYTDSSGMIQPGTLQHWNGTAWSVLNPSPAAQHYALYNIVTGTGPNDVVVAESDGTIARFDGAHWTTTRSYVQAYCVAAVAPGKIWLGTQSGILSYAPMP